MNIFEEVKARVSTLDIARAYGLNPKKKGQHYYCLCPFHNEKDGSLVIYPQGGFKCFGCGEGGDSIKLVQLLNKLKPIEAAQKIAADFCIQIDNSKEFNPKEKREFIKEQRDINTATEFLNKKIESTYDCLCRLYKVFRDLETSIKDKQSLFYKWTKFNLDFFDRYTEKFALSDTKKQIYYALNIKNILEMEYKEWKRWVNLLN